MKLEEFSDWVMLIGMIAVVFILLYVSGCASAPPLSISEAQIDAKIESLKGQTPTDPDAVRYNPEDDTYVVKSPYYKHGISDSMRVDIYEDEIIPEMNEYLAKHPPMTWGERLIKDILPALLIGVIIGGVYGLTAQ